MRASWRLGRGGWQPEGGTVGRVVGSPDGAQARATRPAPADTSALPPGPQGPAMAFRATPARTPLRPGPGIPSASFRSPQAPMAGPARVEVEDEDEDEPAEVSEQERAGRTGRG